MLQEHAKPDYRMQKYEHLLLTNTKRSQKQKELDDPWKKRRSVDIIAQIKCEQFISYKTNSTHTYAMIIWKTIGMQQYFIAYKRELIKRKDTVLRATIA